MRWDALFADLEGEIDAELIDDQRAEVADRTRAELGRLRMLDRLGPLLPPHRGVLRLGLTGHDPVSGEMVALGADWLLLSSPVSGVGAAVLVPFGAVQWMQGLTPASYEPGWEGAVTARSTVRLALRRVVRDRSHVLVGLTGGDTYAGWLAKVGADHVELAATASGESAGGNRAFPLAAMAFVRRL